MPEPPELSFRLQAEASGPRQLRSEVLGIVDKRDNRKPVLARAVLEVLSSLEKAKCRVWVAGGWGVAVLAGQLT